jgi:plastocyanin
MSLSSAIRSALIAASLGAATAAVLAEVILPTWAQTALAAVGIDNFTFGPQNLTVKIGDTVTWTNKDDIPHTVTSTTMAFRSKALDTDDKFSFTFTTPGTFSYFCSLHPNMTGTVVVKPADGHS